MIHIIEGKIQKESDQIYILANARWILAHYSWTQKKGTFFLHPYLDENHKTIQYYAFDTHLQKKRFLWFLKISWIWIRTAFHVAWLDESELQLIVTNLDVKWLQKLPWVWPKTARRILIELQQDFSKESLKKFEKSSNPQIKQLQKYLEWLGYNKEKVKYALEKYPEKITAKNSKIAITTIIKEL
jgi:Holliday junction resolvasome RuvABC DNA-binding subunit